MKSTSIFQLLYKSIVPVVGALLMSTTLSAQAIIRVKQVDTDADQIEIINLGDEADNIGSFWLCLGPGSYVQISNATSDNTNLAPGESLVVDYNVEAAADGFSLFSTPSFSSSDPEILIDYVQWGAGGQPRVGQAVTAGRWDDVNNFVTGSSPYIFNGTATDFGSTFWNAGSPATVSILELACGGEVLQVTGSEAGPTAGGTATDETRTIYAFQPDGAGGVPTYTGGAWPYVVVPNGFTADPSISANITVGANDILLINGWPAYQYVLDQNDQATNGTFGPWFYFETNGALSQDACPPACANPFPAVDEASLMSSVGGSSIATSWAAVPGQIGCQIQVRFAGGNILGSQIIGGANANSFNIPGSALQLGTDYEWRVRCGCSQSPLVAGPFSSWQPFSTPGSAVIEVSPNPTEGQSFATFSVAEEGQVTLEVYDLSGRMVGAIFNGVAQPNNDYRFEFDGSSLPNGIYIYRLTTDRDVQTEKVIISR
ncbi:MAG: T9SS type A sorting domain-containing protein [Bacteroidota bacterium]